MSEIVTADGEIIEGHAVEVYRPPAPPSLFRTDDPVEVIEKATAVADALKRVVANRGLISVISGREHPRVEAWQTLGSMLGVFPVKEWVRPIPWPAPVPESLKSFHDRGLTFGFEASFFAQRPDGAIVGGGEAACMRTESTWRGRDDYALRSMAQTRATSKALKGPLGFVMSLAGYETTPAEEMPDTAAPVAESKPAPPAPAPLDDEMVKAVLAGIKAARMGTEWVRSQLIAVGVENVPHGTLKRSTIEALTPEQADKLTILCEQAAEGKAQNGN